MLPTLVFILWAYGIYGLITVCSQRRGGPRRGRSRGRRHGWLALVGGMGAGLGLICWLSYSPDHQDPRLKMAGFLGTVWAEDWLDSQGQHLEYPPLKKPGPVAKPVYALLHPEAPPGQVGPEKAPSGQKLHRKPRLRKLPANQGKVTRAMAPTPKKDRAANKKLKKKKRSSAPGARKTTSG